MDIHTPDIIIIFSYHSLVNTELRQLADISVKYGKLKSTFEVKSHEAKLCATRLAQSTVSQVGDVHSRIK